MAHDVFVSHSTKDKLAADAVVAHLERSGLRCWCAPRDIVSGSSWATSIVAAINNCKAMVVIFSTSANESGHISREVERAVNRAIPVLPVRIEDVLPRGDLEYFFSSSHWMDAITPPMERHFDRLAEQLRMLLKLDDKSSGSTPKSSSTSSPPAHSTRRLALAFAVIGALGVAILALFLFVRTRKEILVTATPNIPAAEVTPAATPFSTASSTVVASTPAPVPRASVSAPSGQSSVAADFQEWKKLTAITWDNSYLIDHARARFPEWKRAADAGDPIGQFFVGYAYLHGLTVPEEPATGLQWFIKSAEQKNSDAMLAAASCFGLGIGTQPDPLQYGRWIKESLATGNPSAMFTHGFVLFTFSPLPNDKEEGKRLIVRSAATGNLDGLYWSAVISANSTSNSSGKMQKAADGGQPDALFVCAEGIKGSAQGKEMVARALQIMGNPLSVARIIDPTLPFGFNHSNLYPDLASNRLRQMSDEGSAEAARLLAELKEKGKAP